MKQDKEVLAKFAKIQAAYKTNNGDIPMPIYIQYCSIDYSRRDVTDTWCGNIFLNILSKRINRPGYADKSLQDYLMPRIIEFMRDLGNKCEV